MNIENHNHDGADSPKINIENIIGRGNDGDLLSYDTATPSKITWTDVFGDTNLFQIVDYNLLQISDDANASITEGSYTEKKTHTFVNGSGTLTVKFDLYGEGTSGIAWGQLYKNGDVVAGTEESTNSSVTKTITKILAVTTDDVISVKGKLTVGAVPNARISNFRFYFLKTIKPEGAI